MVAGQDRTHQEHTLIHELGHHVDQQNNPEEYQRALAARPQGEAVSPALEGAAEGFAAKHHVPLAGLLLIQLMHRTPRTRIYMATRTSLGASKRSVARPRSRRWAGTGSHRHTALSSISSISSVVRLIVPRRGRRRTTGSGASPITRERRRATSARSPWAGERQPQEHVDAAGLPSRRR